MAATIRGLNNITNPHNWWQRKAAVFSAVRSIELATTYSVWKEANKRRKDQSARTGALEIRLDIGTLNIFVSVLYLAVLLSLLCYFFPVQVGCIVKVVSAAVTLDSFITHPLIGWNYGVADLLVCATAALKLQKKGKSVEVHAVQTRAQTKREAKAEQQADVIRQAEQPVIKLPEVLEQNATSPVLVEDPEQDTAETDEGGNATVVEKGEPVAVINDKVDSNVNLGLIIPSMELGRSLGAEYKGGIAQDDTLR